MKIEYNLDLTGIFGIDITPATHTYIKGGGSYARLVENLSINFTGSPIFQQKAHYDLWGVVLGLGFTRDICRRVSLFGEYDFYDYGNQTLLTANKVSSQVTSETYTQKANNICAYNYSCWNQCKFRSLSGPSRGQVARAYHYPRQSPPSWGLTGFRVFYSSSIVDNEMAAG